MEMYFVEIVRIDSKEVVSRMGPMARNKAERVDSGANINLNHATHYTRIVPASASGGDNG